VVSALVVRTARAWSTRETAQWCAHVHALWPLQALSVSEFEGNELRTLLAAVAMHALIRVGGWVPGPGLQEAIALDAVSLADALLAVLRGGVKPK
jgi:hypothetical protein